jgi:hypothetical protein
LNRYLSSFNLSFPLGDCVAIALKCKFVILNEVKNLIKSMCCKTEILRLGPQNDIAKQAPSGNDNPTGRILGQSLL